MRKIYSPIRLAERNVHFSPDRTHIMLLLHDSYIHIGPFHPEVTPEQRIESLEIRRAQYACFVRDQREIGARLAQQQKDIP